MKLSELLKGIVEIDIDRKVTGIAIDSRQVQNGFLFIAVKGSKQHGLCYASQAKIQGAIAILYDPNDLVSLNSVDLPEKSIAVTGLNLYIGNIVARYFDYPSKKLAVIGITGTNGKTSCSLLLGQSLSACGVIGTLGWGESGKLLPTLNTTPDVITVHRMLADLVKQQKHTVVMEVSSHGLDQGRVDAVEFTGAVFTNLSRDHLDYHGDMASYFQAKLRLFTRPNLKFAVINADDDYALMIKNALENNVQCWMYSWKQKSINGAHTVLADEIRFTPEGVYFLAQYAEQKIPAFAPLLGVFNLENVLAVLTVLLAMGVTFTDAVSRLLLLKAVPGRMETFGGNDKPIVYVDYAHTPDALQKALLAAKGGGRLWVVFGCGGNRDKGKRPEMGLIAEKFADKVIITDDNPRDESANSIIKDILTGCHKQEITVINDRALAISSAISQADKQDSILIAGKGHESYQEIKGQKLAFSDQEYVKQALATWQDKHEINA